MNKKEIGIIVAGIVWGTVIPLSYLGLVAYHFDGGDFPYSKASAMHTLSVFFVGQRYYPLGYIGPRLTLSEFIWDLWLPAAEMNLAIYAAVGVGLALLLWLRRRPKRTIEQTRTVQPQRGVSYTQYEIDDFKRRGLM